MWFLINNNMTYFKDFLEKRKAEIREGVQHASNDDKSWLKKMEERHRKQEIHHEDRGLEHRKSRADYEGGNHNEKPHVAAARANFHDEKLSRHSTAQEAHSEVAGDIEDALHGGKIFKKTVNNIREKSKKAFKHSSEARNVTPADFHEDDYRDHNSYNTAVPQYR